MVSVQQIAAPNMYLVLYSQFLKNLPVLTTHLDWRDLAVWWPLPAHPAWEATTRLPRRETWPSCACQTRHPYLSVKNHQINGKKQKRVTGRKVMGRNNSQWNSLKMSPMHADQMTLVSEILKSYYQFITSNPKEHEWDIFQKSLWWELTPCRPIWIETELVV